MAEQDDRDIINALRSMSQGEEIEQSEQELIEEAAAIPVARPTAKGRRVRSNLPSLHRQQTMIPILLTCAVLLWVFATLRFVVYADSPLANLPLWSSVVGYLGGGVLLMGAVVNMVSVRFQLRSERRLQ